MGSLQALYCLIAFAVLATLILLGAGVAFVKRGLLQTRLEIIVWLLASIAPAVLGWGTLAAKVFLHH